MILRKCILSVALIAMSGCSGLLAAVTGGTPPPPQAEPVKVDRMLRVNVVNFNRELTLVAAQRNGNRVTWVGAENISVTLENGILVATRGLPRDLMGANVSSVASSLRGNGGSSQRSHDFLSNFDIISTELLQCSIVSEETEAVEIGEKTQNLRRFKESCEGKGLIFTNIYWVNDAGGLRRSLQLVSPEVGYLQIDVF